MPSYLKGTLILTLFIGMISTALFYLVTASTPLIQSNKEIDSEHVTRAKSMLSRIAKQIKDDEEKLDILVTQDELDGLSNLAANAFEFTRFEAFIKGQQITAAIAHQPDEEDNGLFINAYCTFYQSALRFEAEYCQIGSLPVPKSVANWFIEYALEEVMGPKLGPTLIELMANVEVRNNHIRLFTNKPEQLQVHKLKKSLIEVSQNVTHEYLGLEIDSDRFAEYYVLLQQIELPNQPLVYYMNHVFRQASTNSLDYDPVEENRAAMWALASFFGDTRFARFAGIEVLDLKKSQHSTSISGRQDLALHFLYSSVLDQISGSEIGFKIGELKELNDADHGGSGYSFADLAADKAGILFSQRLTENERIARHSQRVLANADSESIFFPVIESLPEQMTYQQLSAKIGVVGSKEYEDFTELVSQKVSQLPLYRAPQPLRLPARVPENKPPQPVEP